jgi:hypothetical protein
MILCPILPTDAPPLPDAAFSMTAPGYAACYSIWEEAGHDEGNIRWLRSLIGALEPLAMGRYVGESDIVANPSQVFNSYASSNWERLQAMREEYDPDRVFHSYTVACSDPSRTKRRAGCDAEGLPSAIGGQRPATCRGAPEALCAEFRHADISSDG